MAQYACPDYNNPPNLDGYGSTYAEKVILFKFFIDLFGGQAITNWFSNIDIQWFIT